MIAPFKVLPHEKHTGQLTSAGTLLAASERTVAWLSLGEEDNDPARFLAAMVAAGKLAANAGTTAQRLLQTLDNPGEQAQRIVGAMINDLLLALPHSAVLVLDDLHLVVDESIYTALDYMIDRLPPQLRLVFIARHEPSLALARLRARGQLATVRLAALRFTLEEATAFLFLPYNPPFGGCVGPRPMLSCWCKRT